MTEHDETRLPRWARNELQRLRSNLEHAHKRLSAGPESKVVADPFATAPRWLGDHTVIEFRLPSGVIRLRIEEDRLYANSSSGRLAIEPSASNSIHLVVGGLSR